MLLRFGAFELDTDRAELRGAGGPVAMEPKALSLLTLLAENSGRVVDREEMIASVWHGRVVSDAAVSTALKLVRRALGDDGEAQAYVRTMHGRGHRFVADVRFGTTAPAPQGRLAGGQPTLAVLPFRLLGDPGPWQALPEAMAAEVIASLSRLRWLRVIARESTFRLRNEVADLDAVREVLGAGYSLSGVVETMGGRLAVSLELAETQHGVVLWADRFSGRLDEVHELRAAIVAAVIAALDSGITRNEAEVARSRPSESLDAWGAFHLGLAHIYRFNAHDNTVAAGLLRQATELDPGFASAWAARSFASFQAASMGYVPDRDRAVRDARATAERSIELDPLEPTANCAMGRVSILIGKPGEGGGWLDRSVGLSPSYARGHYARAFIDMLTGRTEAAIEGIDRAVTLSPLDPLMGAMLGMRSLSLVQEGRLAEALEAARRAARAAPAHVINVMQAAATAALNGHTEEAERLAHGLRERRPDATLGLFKLALPMADTGALDAMCGALRSLGFPE